MGKRKVNICQPGFGASCALCCGSHNYSEKYNEIRKLFIFRNKKYRPQKNSFKDKMFNKSEKKYNLLINDAMQCDYVGFIDNDKKIVGCLIYTNKCRQLNFDFFNKTCKIFSCISKEVLTDNEIIFAASLMKDWFYYSLLINDVPFLQKLCSSHKNHQAVGSKEKKEIKHKLKEAAYPKNLIKKS